VPTNGLAPPDMPWLFTRPGQPNGLGPPVLNYAAPPDAGGQTLGSAVADTGANAWQWLQDQRAESVRQGLLDPETGLPTQKGIVQGVGDTAQGVMMGTTAPKAGVVSDLANFATQARKINQGTMNEAAQRGQKPADGTLLWFLDGDKATYQNAHGSDARLHRGDELSEFPSVPVQNTDGSVSRVWFKEGQDEQAAQVARALQMPLGAERDRALGSALGYAPEDVARYTAPQQQPPGIRAYHGSPHSFEAFDTSKIGTGEGAQAYGHGLYFAEGEGVARQYRDQLAGKGVDFEWNGQPVPPGQPAFQLVDALGEQDWRLGKIAEQAAKYGPRNAIDTFEPHTRNASDGPAWQAAMDQFKQGAGKSATGSMYEVNIGADPEHFLHWDKPLSEQSQYVQDALTPERLGLKPAGPLGDKGWYGYTDETGRLVGRATTRSLPDTVFHPSELGMSVYRGAGSWSDPAATAERFKAAGIPGIRYLDQGSRGAGQGTHNYVVFDAKTIDILRKYGIAGLIAGGGAAAAGTQQQQPPTQ